MGSWIHKSRLDGQGKPLVKEFGGMTPDQMLFDAGWRPYSGDTSDLAGSIAAPKIPAPDTSDLAGSIAALLSGETLSNPELDKIIAAKSLDVKPRTPLHLKIEAVKKALINVAV